jgi:hypothetical protein
LNQITQCHDSYSPSQRFSYSFCVNVSTTWHAEVFLDDGKVRQINVKYKVSACPTLLLAASPYLKKYSKISSRLRPRYAVPPDVGSASNHMTEVDSVPWIEMQTHPMSRGKTLINSGYSRPMPRCNCRRLPRGPQTHMLFGPTPSHRLLKRHNK